MLENEMGRIMYRLIPRPAAIFIIVTSIVLGLVVLGSCGGEPTETQYTLTVNIDGNGTSDSADTYNQGTTVSINADPDPEWEFVEWTGDIGTISDRISSSTTIVMDGDYTITARFRLLVITPTNISNLVFDPPWPVTLDYGEQVNFEFHYYIDERFPVVIIPRPISNGTIAPGYLASGSNQYEIYMGKGESGFTINSQSGQVVIDQIRFEIANVYQSAVLYEFFFPVSYTFQ
jgi:hypothetical protein